jgi:nucleoside-diphosphate-sugar epimerase
MRSVCVTGASGYIGSWVTKMLLDEGLNVHATVRTLDRNDKNKHLFLMQETYPKLKLFQANLLEPESFMPALEGCDTLFHTASPVIILNIKNPEEQLLRPAVEGTVGILSELIKIPSMRRVVLTSSIAAVAGGADSKGSGNNGYYTEEDWNEIPNHPYYKSKTMAEKSAWEIAKQQSQWTLTTLNPGLVMGPSLSKRTEGMSVGFMKDLLSGKYPLFAPNLSFSCVDVREVAKAHILAAKTGMGRHIIVNKSISIVNIGKILKSHFPRRWYLPIWTLPNFLIRCLAPLLGIDKEFLERNLGREVHFDNKKSVKLGVQYRGLKIPLLIMLIS